MSKLIEIKYDGLALRNVNVPDSYVSYTYNDSLTVLDNLYAIWNELKKVNIYLGEVVDLVNAMVDFLNGEGLKSHVTEKLEEWLEDGTLEDLINDALFNSKADKVWVEEQIRIINESLNDTREYVDEEVFKNKEYVDEEVLKNKEYVDEEVLKNKEYVDAYGKNLDKVKSKVMGVEHLLYANNGIYFMHRGLSQYSPENSKYAVEYAGWLGAKGVEVDAIVTADGKVVISHDDTMSTMSDSTNLISTSSYETVTNTKITKGNNVGLFWQPKFMGLEQLLYEVKRYNLHCLIELKFTWTKPNMRYIMDMIYEYGLQDQVGLMVFEIETVQMLREVDKNFNIGWVLYNEVTQEHCDIVKELGNCFISFQWWKGDSRTNIRMLQRNDIPFTIWTVDELIECESLMKMGAKSITSNVIKGTRPQLKEKIFMFQFGNGKFEQNTEYAFEPCKITLATWNQIKIDYAFPFTAGGTHDDWITRRRGPAFAQLFGNMSKSYYAGTSGEMATGITLTIRDSVTNDTVDVKTISGWVKIVVYGYDFVN